MCAAAAAAPTTVAYESGSSKFQSIDDRSFRVFFLLVKAFLAKAKDEFQVKYDKPCQVCVHQRSEEGRVSFTSRAVLFDTVLITA
jgi:hypothetical protein